MKQWHCRTCGGTNVYSDAYVNMNDPEDVRVYDDTFCDDCEGECSVEEREAVEVLYPSGKYKVEWDPETYSAPASTAYLKGKEFTNDCGWTDEDRQRIGALALHEQIGIEMGIKITRIE